METGKDTLVIVPALNEEETIAQVVRNLNAHLPDADVLVVDDGSTDKTGDLARAEGAKVVTLPFNCGIGTAMQTGFKYALDHGYRAALQVDADGQHPPREAGKLLGRLGEGWHLVVGSRFVEDTGYRGSALRRFGIGLFSWMIYALTGKRVYDPTSGFRAMSSEALELFYMRYPHDYPEVEALILLDRNGLTFTEVPVSMEPRKGGRSSISVLSGAYYMIKVSLAVLVTPFKKKELK